MDLIDGVVFVVLFMNTCRGRVRCIFFFYYNVLFFCSLTGGRG
jgi:hypothetical protein